MRRSMPFYALAFMASAAFALEDARPQAEFVVGMGSYDLNLNLQHSLYAHEMQLYTAIYEGLFSYDPATLEPVLAEAASWKRSKDGKVYTFALRPGLRWSNGEPLLASHYRDAWLSFIAPETKAEYGIFFDIIKGAKAFRTGATKDPSTVGIKAVGKDVLEVTLASPASYFTRLLCHSAFSPVHPSLLGKRIWKAGELVTNGPFRIVQSSGRELSLARSEPYWDSGNVKLPALRVIFFESEEEATAKFNSGEVHWLTDMADVETIVDKGALQYSAMFGTNYFLWNCAAKPWNDDRVRRALALLVPWELIRNPETYFSPTSRLILPFQGYKSPDGIEKADEAEAMRLLSEAGYPGGAGLPALRFLVPDVDSTLANVEVMKAAWKKSLKLEVEVDKQSATNFSRDSKQRPYTVTTTSWIGDFADAAAFLLMFTSDSGLNEGKYSSREYDALLSQSMSQDGEERLSSLSKAEGILLSGAAVIPVYHSLAFNAIDLEAVSGWFDNPLDVHPFKGIWFGEYKASPLVASAR